MSHFYSSKRLVTQFTSTVEGTVYTDTAFAKECTQGFLLSVLHRRFFTDGREFNSHFKCL